MEKRKENFISKATQKFNSKFDYSKVDYINNKTEVCIICPIHGEFYTTPETHLRSKTGCPFCGHENSNRKRRLSQEEFIEKAKEIHGDKYSYEKTKYLNQKSNIVVTCPIHGEFSIRPDGFLAGRGCQKCSRRLPDSQADKNRLYYTYKQGALKRGIDFELSLEDFTNLISQNCVYCHSEPKSSYIEYAHNGIDRIDNSKGYTIDNCVPCCSMCNFMKHDYSLQDFLHQIGKIYKIWEKHINQI